MSALHDDMRSLIAELDARRARVLAKEAAPRVPSAPAAAPAYSWRATCSLCDAPSPLQVCPRCSAALERSKGIL